MPLPFIRKRKKGSSIEKERLNNGSYNSVVVSIGCYDIDTEMREEIECYDIDTEMREKIECYDTDTEMREKLGNGNYHVIRPV